VRNDEVHLALGPLLVLGECVEDGGVRETVEAVLPSATSSSATHTLRSGMGSSSVGGGRA